MHTLQLIGGLYNSSIPFILAICNLNVYYEIWLYRGNKISKFHNLNENEFFGYINYYLFEKDLSQSMFISNIYLNSKKIGKDRNGYVLSSNTIIKLLLSKYVLTQSSK